MRVPATVKIGDEDSGKNRRIAQEVVFLPSEARKRAKLVEVLQRAPRPVIVFVNAKKQCDVIARELEDKGFNCTVLHSGKTQDLREDALAEFKAGTFDVLIATDVAGRGLDIPDVAQVINYDMPSEIDRYTHRIGRTGRAGKTGKAVTFLTEDDMGVIPALKAYLDATGQPVPPDVAARASGEAPKSKVQFARK
jgi:ATP-dependent RNA helicase DDX23/PRP28